MELIILFGVAVATVFGLVTIMEISEFVQRNEDNFFKR